MRQFTVLIANGFSASLENTWQMQSGGYTSGLLKAWFIVQSRTFVRSTFNSLWLTLKEADGRIHP
ncbi:MAG: hypothetical protein KKD13_04230 [Candidatus Margulisbacteria bacterium]|nr:hypothetical protein [Candidatus Margulisiibacteriota bacterium]